MQQKFFSKKKKEKDMEMLNFEKKCGKLPIDKCKKNLFNERKKFCEIQKIVKNFNHVLRKSAYYENNVKNFFQLPLASFLPPLNTKWRLFFEKFSKNLKSFNFVLRINGYHDNCILLRNADRIANRWYGILAINTINDDGYHIIFLKNAVFSVKPVQIPIKWPEKKFWNINGLLTITRYHWNCHINRFLKILHGVQSPVPRRKRTPVSMFKKSIYIINVFINQATDALRGLSINKIGDYLYTTTLKKELLVVFFNLLKKYFISPRIIKFV